jgi:hypothetical protein
MEIQDTPARQALIRLFAKRREYIMLRLAATYPEKKERLQRLKPMAFEHSALEPIVKELREVEF